MKDTLINILLSIKNWINYNIFKNEYVCIIPNTYELSYKDDFNDTFNIDDKYIRKQVWGDYHDNDLQQWYDPNAVQSLSNGLNLSITENIKEVINYSVNGQLLYNQKPVVIEHGVGLVTSKQAFGYGIFEWNIILPKGSNLWPAIWLSSELTWPPEIDILEGYSDKNGKYGRNVNTNIHCGTNNKTHYSVGANRHGLFIDVNKQLNLVCHWTKDYIKIYYNGYLARIVYNKTNITWFNNINMYVIMNNAIRQKITNHNDFISATISPLIINDFKYYKLK